MSSRGPQAGQLGTRVVLDRRTGVLQGGRALLSPTGRLLRLAPEGPAAVEALARGQGGASAHRLGRVLVDAGAAHPLPEPGSAEGVTVVVPVKDRVAELEECLGALSGYEVLVVDDGSAQDVAGVCARHGAAVVRRAATGGPAAARNATIPLLRKEIVAFLDSDCVPPAGWVERLVGHFADPAVVAVAPRVGGPGSLLDLGPHPAQVRPGGAVAYVPTAALLVRRSALVPFDEDLRYGEDVDLVWRLVERGGVVRYDPRVVVEHREPWELAARAARRFRYGTSAAPLARRHPGALTHLVLPPWPTAVLGLLLARRARLALAAGLVAAWRLDRQLHAPLTSARVVATATGTTAVGTGRALAQLGPVGWSLAARHRWLAPLLLAPVLQQWWRQGRPEGLGRFASRVLVEEAAYGAGVLAGCLRHLTVEPLVPRRRAERSSR